ncbi:MAG: hypothetical protein IT283_02535 [Bacteroidetes bacterium]|nr:hypothetical protein [Bacteroidota bacterium]
MLFSTLSAICSDYANDSPSETESVSKFAYSAGGYGRRMLNNLVQNAA